MVQHGGADLVQRREGELHLGLDTGCPDDPASRGRAEDVLQERGLADTSFSADHQGPALPALDIGEELFEQRAFARPVQQHVVNPPA
ncbi:hypothetical protein GCM10009559_75770 [Pseudonocardia zijingensis]|uniref:Uncharacterized protein n=1 Tax=Pseudonocardia zijingensis TaxID=153376 RepID=A0ABN1NGT7_9PSEU